MSKAREHDGKRGHEKRKDCEDALFNFCRRTGAKRTRYEVYKCSVCGLFHYGHRKHRRFQPR